MVHSKPLAPLYVEHKLIPAYICHKRPILLLWQLWIDATIGDLRTRASFLVAETLSVYFLLGTNFINRHKLDILRNKLKVLLQNSRSISILLSSSKTVSNTVIADRLGTV